MAMSMEDIIDKGVVTEKEPLVVFSRRELKAICKEMGITNERRVASEYSSIVNFNNQIQRARKMGDDEEAQKLENQVERLIETWKEDDSVTHI